MSKFFSLGRILALDYGKKRTGLAVTDILQLSINPLPTVLTVNLKFFLKDYFEAYEVDTLVLGYPTHADGRPTNLSTEIEKFVNFIKRKFPSLQISYVDEAYTSVDARNIMIQMGVKKKDRMKKENIDKGSAILILKSYLETLK